MHHIRFPNDYSGVDAFLLGDVPAELYQQVLEPRYLDIGRAVPAECRIVEGALRFIDAVRIDQGIDPRHLQSRKVFLLTQVSVVRDPVFGK